jgi:Uma2 family endonuclease
MSTQTIASRELLARLPADSTLILRNVAWDDYEALLVAVGEAPGLRISYQEGTLQIMTLSSEHENCTRLLEKLIDRLSARLRIRILSFGSMTMKRKDRDRGTEPDACFYVKTAALLGPKRHIDFTKDPPPDIAVEIDVHQDSIAKFPLYAVLEIPEIWRYDGSALTIHRLQGEEYVSVPCSVALPVLDAGTLTRFLNLLSEKDQYDVLLAFEDWLDSVRGA